VLAIDQLAARFTMLSIDEAFADRVDASADAVAGVEEADVESAGVQIARGREAREAGTDDDDRRSTGWIA
jgi:hypothetical protein